MSTIAISGTRTPLTDHDKAIIRRQLGWGRKFKRERFVRIGDCPTGVDAYVENLFRGDGFQNFVIYRARWENEGRGAGPIRNRRLVKDPFIASVAFAFPRKGEPNRGTRSFIEEAMAAEVPVLVVHWLNAQQ